jgi:hypothetical protein
MRRLSPPALLAFVLGILITGNAFAATYYVSTSGSDSNNGTSKTTPWAHAPGMASCSGVCASTSPKPGDQFILRGGDTWASSSLPWSWHWSGSSGSNIVIGVDQTWFAGSSWVRPILSGDGTWPGSSTGQFFLSIGSNSYVEVANLEFTGYYLSAGATSQTGYFYTGGGSNDLIHDNYMHGWTHSAGVAEGSPGGNVNAFTCSGSQSDLTTKLYNNVVDGSDTDKQSFGALYTVGGCNNVYQNYFAWMADAVNENGIILFHDNVESNTGMMCYSGCGTHNNVMESNNDPVGGMFTYNNLFIFSAPSDNQGGIVIQLAPKASYTSYFFNNVVIQGPPYEANEIVCADPLVGSGSGSACTIFNNTVEGGVDSGPPSGTIVRAGSFNGHIGPSAINLYNNHVISSNSTIVTTGDCSNSACTVTQLPSVQTRQSLSTANGQGYASTQAFAFSPTSSSGSTVGAGVNESALCSTISVLNATAGAACKYDTTYGVTYDEASHTITGLARTPIQRPASGAWDAGAYQFGTGSQPPSPPTGLSAVIQ